MTRLNKTILIWILTLTFLGVQKMYSQKAVSDSLFDWAAVNVFDHPDKVIEIAELRYKTSKELDKQVSALLLLANAYSGKTDYLKATEYAIKARDISQKKGDQKLELKVLNTIAIQYIFLGVYDKAFQYLDQADKIATDFPVKDSIRMILGNNQGIRGMIYRDQLSCDIAINYFNKAYNEYKYERKNPKMIANMSLISAQKGECFLTMHQIDSARNSFQKSYNLAKELKSLNLMSYARRGMADILTMEGKYKESLSLLKEVQTENKKVEVAPELDAQIYQRIAYNFLAIGDFGQYQNYYKQYQKTEKKLMESKRSSVSNSIKKNKEKNEGLIKKELFQFYSFVIGFGIILIIILISIFKGKSRFEKEFEVLKQNLSQIRKNTNKEIKH